MNGGAGMRDQRRLWPLALDLEDLTIGSLIIRVHSYLIEAPAVERVTSEPYTNRGLPGWVDTINLNRTLRAGLYTADYGLTPYGDDGPWNDSNYIRRPSEMELAKLLKERPEIAETLFTGPSNTRY